MVTVADARSDGSPSPSDRISYVYSLPGTTLRSWYVVEVPPMSAIRFPLRKIWNRSTGALSGSALHVRSAVIASAVAVKSEGGRSTAGGAA